MLVHPKARVSIFNENVKYSDSPLQVNPNVLVVSGTINDYMTNLSSQLGQSVFSQVAQTVPSVAKKQESKPLTPVETKEPESAAKLEERVEVADNGKKEGEEEPLKSPQRKNFRISSGNRCRSVTRDRASSTKRNEEKKRELNQTLRQLDMSTDSKREESFLWKSRVLEKQLRVEKFRESFKLDARTRRKDKSLDKTRKFNAVLEDVLQAQNDLEQNEVLLKQVHKIHESKRINDLHPKLANNGRISNFLTNINDLHSTSSRNGYTRGVLGKFYTK